jgi:uncharacterized protein YidB (DUF937 family)
MTFIDTNPDAATHTGLISSVLSQAGGIGGLIQGFQKQGLSGVMQSWIGTGQNLPITTSQIASVIGTENLKNIASKFGMTPEQAQEKLSTLLPQVIDTLTPNGQVHEDHFSMGNLMSLGQSLLHS